MGGVEIWGLCRGIVGKSCVHYYWYVFCGVSEFLILGWCVVRHSEIQIFYFIFYIKNKLNWWNFSRIIKECPLPTKFLPLLQAKQKWAKAIKADTWLFWVIYFNCFSFEFWESHLICDIWCFLFWLQMCVRFELCNWIMMKQITI